jgi:HAMP domain-containing protein
MDARTRLALVLVTTSLLSMLALGTFAYQTAYSLLREVSERQLDALAESKRDDLNKVIVGWRDRVELVRSRTRLRMLIADYDENPSEESIREIRKILSDALSSSRSIARVTVFDRHGDPITSTGSMGRAQGLALEKLSPPESVTFGGTLIGSNDDVLVRFLAPLRYDDVTIGALDAIIDAEDIQEVTGDFTGLGESGETQLFMASGPDEVLMLSPLRHDETLRRISVDRESHLVSVLLGEERVYRTGIFDYRGVEVWCATRLVGDVGWGIVVKIDHAEETMRARRLRDEMLDVGLSLGAIAILVGTLIGFRLGRPIRELKEIVERVRAGEEDLRAEFDVGSRDEVGFLADALNDLLDERQRRK